MKKLVLIALTLMVTLGIQAQKATSEQTSEITVMQSIYGMGKRDVVAKFMQFTEAEATKFWPLYDQYEAARKEIGTKRANNIIDFANNYANLTNEKADEIAKASFAVNVSMAKLHKSTYAKVSKAISPLRAAQFYQMELYLEEVVRLELMSQVPVIGEFDIKK